MSMRWTPVPLRSYLAADGGAAAVEFAIWLMVLVPATIGAVDLGLYAYDTTQVYAAAQSAAQAARSTVISGSCDFTSGQTLSSCTGLSSAATTAMTQSGPLGSSMSKNSEALNYYCSNKGTNSAGSVGTSSSSCSNTGYYYNVEVRMAYTPLFSGAPSAGVLTASSTSCPASTICQTAVLRIE
jgi:Flp pilus assembly protein TadG